MEMQCGRCEQMGNAVEKLVVVEVVAEGGWAWMTGDGGAWRAKTFRSQEGRYEKEEEEKEEEELVGGGVGVRISGARCPTSAHMFLQDAPPSVDSSPDVHRPSFTSSQAASSVPSL
ncbi:hypothetical protein E2C01_042502 [Portunus trituberculatus]|uniref:Uncharacterized protein n=1 Tax=Portunus trituberculatus TaxID=210409 RepID=A0A5B7FMK7_PORTR|nr:hypothetical protein [Portunus trituberculatus]